MRKIQIGFDFIRNHKYAVTIVFFILLLCVIDENSLWNQHLRQLEIDKMNELITSYQNKYYEDTRKLDELENNPSAVERLARERYYMKRENEDVFLFLSSKTESTDSIE